MEYLDLDRPFRPQEDRLDRDVVTFSHGRRIQRATIVELAAYLVAGGLLYVICRMIF